jgi:hypothetical protein
MCNQARKLKYSPMKFKCYSKLHHFNPKNVDVRFCVHASVILDLFVTQIFYSGQPSHGGDRKTFEVMTST